MRKIFAYVLLALLVFWSISAQAAQRLNPDKIYFFYSDYCPHCHHAQQYIDKKYPNLQMTKVDVQTPKGYALLFYVAKEYQLGDQIGTPLFIMGKNHIMGWSDEYEKQFDEYVKPFIK